MGFDDFIKFVIKNFKNFLCNGTTQGHIFRGEKILEKC